jgi:hypothetical protein
LCAQFQLDVSSRSGCGAVGLESVDESLSTVGAAGQGFEPFPIDRRVLATRIAEVQENRPLEPNTGSATSNGAVVCPGEEEALAATQLCADDYLNMGEGPIVDVDSDVRVAVQQLAHNDLAVVWGPGHR